MKAKSKPPAKRKSAGKAKGKRKPIMRHSREGMTVARKKSKGKRKPIMRHGREG